MLSGKKLCCIFASEKFNPLNSFIMMKTVRPPNYVFYTIVYERFFPVFLKNHFASHHFVMLS